MAYEFRTEALAGLIGAAPWSSYLGQPVKVIVEPDEVDKSQFKATTPRNSRSSCYFDFYVGKQSFEGGFIKAHLFSEFSLRSIGAAPSSAIVWSETKGFPARDQTSIPTASQTIRDAFVSNVGKFLRKKLASRDRN
jgi:hypothetical protein